ncbi:hypothetical protein D3C71_880890 [compost metagenome]
MAGDGMEALATQAVHAHVQRGQPGPVPARQTTRQQAAVGGDGHLADARHARHGFDDLIQILAQARLTAGQADLVHAQGGERAYQPLDFGHRHELRLAVGLIAIR